MTPHGHAGGLTPNDVAPQETCAALTIAPVELALPGHWGRPLGGGAAGASGGGHVKPDRLAVLPMRDGVGPSCVALPVGPWATISEFLLQRFPSVPALEWAQRMQAGDVVDEWGQPVTPERPYQPHMRLYYYRSLEPEPVVPFEEVVLFQDAHLLVVDKPPFLPVTPTGFYLQQTLLVRLKRRLGIENLVPLHRLDRDTAGVMLFSIEPATRGAYHSLFRDRLVTKHYEALAPWRADLVFPLRRHTLIVESPQFFRMWEQAGAPNADTTIDVLEVKGNMARYSLSPLTGRRHQLRVHMAALGIPIVNDHFYPEVNDPPKGDYSEPLQLLAKRIAFTDPLTGQEREFESQRRLEM